MADEFNLPKTEEKILKFWDTNQVFEKSLLKNQPTSSKLKPKTFVFYEGPPYANGKPGIHHVLARVVKDVILRYKTMRGYYVPRRGGGGGTSMGCRLRSPPKRRSDSNPKKILSSSA